MINLFVQFIVSILKILSHKKWDLAHFPVHQQSDLTEFLRRTKTFWLNLTFSTPWPFSWHSSEWWVLVFKRVTWQNFDACTGTILLDITQWPKIKLLAFSHLSWIWNGEKNSWRHWLRYMAGGKRSGPVVETCCNNLIKKSEEKTYCKEISFRSIDRI